MATNELLRQRERLEAACASASAALKSFPRMANGLTPDFVRTGVDYQTAKARYNSAFRRLRSFNQRYAKRIRKAEEREASVDFTARTAQKLGGLL